MAKFQILCGQCEKPIDSSMKKAIEAKECPYCGSPIVDTAFEALEVSQIWENVFKGSGEELSFVQRKNIIFHMLEVSELPQIDMVPEEEDKIKPKLIIESPTAPVPPTTPAPPVAPAALVPTIPAATPELATPVTVGGTEGRGDGKPAAVREGGTPPKSGGAKPFDPVAKRKAFSTGGISFGDAGSEGSADELIGSGETVVKEMADLEVPVNPLDSMQGGGGTLSGKDYSVVEPEKQ